MRCVVSTVWAKVHNIAQVVEIALPGIASDFAWENGGNPGRVPSDFTFDALGTTVHEQVFERSHADTYLRYRLVVPALGITSYTAIIAVDDLGAGRSLLTFSRDLSFEDPAVVPDFAALFELEIANMQAYFAP